MDYQSGQVMAMSSAEKSARYRAKDVDAYRKQKAEYAKTPAERARRTEYMRAWREKNRERFNQQARESRARHRDAVLDRARRAGYVKKYGITLEDKEAMITAQGGACLICRTAFASARTTHVDHDHQTGRVRGILCHACNTKLGWFEAHQKQIKDYLA